LRVWPLDVPPCAHPPPVLALRAAPTLPLRADAHDFVPLLAA